MKALVLSSGGVDSTTCLALAVESFGRENVATLSIYYGQKHDKEIECARKVAEYYGVPHYEKDVTDLMSESNCSLLKKSNQEIPHESYGDQLSKTDGKPVSTYVPFRNGLFLSIAATMALSIFNGEETTIYCGMHADDAAGNAYPDCSPQFNEAMKKAIWFGSGDTIIVRSPLVNKTKKQVVALGAKLNAPYRYTWSCYEGGEKACGKCGTCIDRINAFKANGLEDPIEYDE